MAKSRVIAKAVAILLPALFLAPASPGGLRPADAAETTAPAQGQPEGPENLQFQQIKSGNRISLYVSGPIKEGDYARFRNAIVQAGSVDELLLDSPGGDLFEAIEIGRMIRSRGLATHIPDGAYCVSACNFLFMGGQVRTIDTDGVFGVHMFTAVDSEIQDLAAAKNGDEVAAAVQNIEQSAANAAAEIARFLVEMQISLRFLTEFADIPNAEPRALTRQELREFGIINTD